MRKFLFLFLIIFAKNSFSQEVFKHYNFNYGLSQSVVKCIYQDYEGFLWVGTQDGLNKFDGYEFLNFKHNSENDASISNNWIYNIIEDKDSNLWIATRKGLNKFNKKKNIFEKYGNENENDFSIFKNVVCGLAINKNGNIIANTPPYINIFDKNKNQFERINTGLEYDGSVIDENLPIIVDKYENIWIASKKGLVFYNPKNKKIKVYTKENNLHIPDNHITALFEDFFGNIWIGTKNGLVFFNQKKQNFFNFKKDINNPNYLKNNFIRSIYQDNNRNIWVGTNGGGLHKLVYWSNDNYKFINFKSKKKDENSINHNIVLSLLEDNSKNLWIGTLNGIDKLDLKKKKFQIYQNSNKYNSVNLSDNVIASVFKKNENEIWIGTWGKGLNIYNKINKKVVLFSTENIGNQYISNDFIHTIYKDKKKNIWIGTRNGIDIYDEKNNKFIALQDFFGTKKIHSFRNFRVNHIINDDENIWIATQNGLFKINVEKDIIENFTEENEQISSNLVYQILIDSEKNLWIATTKGLDKYNLKNENFEYFKNKKDDKNSLSNNFVVTICEDKFKNIWIGTESGLDKFDKKNKKFKHFYKKDGVTNSVIYEIIEYDNNIWIASGNGLFKYDILKNKFEIFKLEDGLQGMEFNTACFKSKNGELFFGGMNGVNYFYPDSIKNNKYVPPIVITSIEKTNDNGKKKIFDFNQNNEINLSYLDFDLTIKFASLDYTDPKQNLYSYKMNAISENWINIKNRNFINFPYLSPGEYIFKIKGSNNDGIWNEKGKELKIIIEPPWWKTKISYFFYFIIIIIFIIFLIKLREKKLLKEKILLEMKVQKRTKEIMKQKNIIEKNHKHLTSSINYASLIQNAILPNIELFEKYFVENFILFKPRDIVSGDFYYFAKINENIIFAAADCTGHGVPGAFVSMLGISFLNEIVARKDITKANEVLESLREKIKTSLKQETNRNKDGMDISFCVYNTRTNYLQFSGANNPIYIIRDKNLIELKADRQPIGIYVKEKKFKNNIFHMKKNDIIYLFSDGYVDQFGGEKDKKFTKRRFREMILENHDKNLKEQKIIFNNIFEDWKLEKKQIDDVLVIAIKI